MISVSLSEQEWEDVECAIGTHVGEFCVSEQECQPWYALVKKIKDQVRTAIEQA